MRNRDTFQSFSGGKTTNDLLSLPLGSSACKSVQCRTDALARTRSFREPGDFSVTNLVSNNLADNPGQIQDPNLVNPWGISQAGPTGPFWVSDNGTGVSTLYSVSAANDTTTKLGLTVTIPGAGNVTGQDFNTAAASGAFHGDSFLFVSEDGTVSGCAALGTTAETLVAGSAANDYQGSTLVTNGANAYLLAANEKTGNIDVIKGRRRCAELDRKLQRSRSSDRLCALQCPGLERHGLRHLFQSRQHDRGHRGCLHDPG